MPKWVDQGDDLVAEILFNASLPPGTYYVGLYLNTTEPVDGAVLADLTEPSGGGYARQGLDRGTEWTVTDNEAQGDQVTFTATAGWGDVYGYFICDVSTGTVGNLLAVEQFTGGPFNVGASGNINVVPKVIIDP